MQINYKLLRGVLLSTVIPAIVGATFGVGYMAFFGPTSSGEPMVGASVLFPYQGGTGTGTAPNTGGKFLISTSGGVYSPAYITAGSNISVATSSGGFTISSTGGGGSSGNVSDGLDIANSGDTYYAIASLQFDAGHFTFSNTASNGYVRTDWGAGGPASLSQAETISADWVNTANPWTDNEVADTITASNYLPLAGGTLTGNLVGTGASFSTGEFTTYASASLFYGAGLVDCDTAATSKLLWSSTGAFSCGTDQTGAGGSVSSNSLDFDELVDAMTLDANTSIASAAFDLTVGSQIKGWAGSVGSPSYSFSLDPDTGLYRQAADTIAFSTGGLERMRIGSTGAVDIGVNGTAISGTAKALIVNNGTSTGNIFEAQDNGTPSFVVANGGTVTMDGGVFVEHSGTRGYIYPTSGSDLSLGNSGTDAYVLTIGGSSGIGQVANFGASLPIVARANVYLGNGITDASPIGVVLGATGGSGTNIKGAILTIAGGKGTGLANGGSISFQTSIKGSSGTTLQTLTDRMTILSSGSVGIGTTRPIGQFEIIGDADTLFRVASTSNLFSISDTGSLTTTYDCSGNTNSGKLTVGANGIVVCGNDVSDGVASNALDWDEIVPAMTLDTNTTVASAGFGLNFSTGGLGVKSGGTINTPFEVGGTASISRILAGTSLLAASPSYAFTADKNTGFSQYSSPGSDQIDVIIGGVVGYQFTSSDFYIGGAKALYLDATNGYRLAASSTAALPTYTWTDDVNTGMYSIGANIIGFTANGTKIASASVSRWEINTGASLSGTLFAPNITNSNTGDYVCFNTTTGEIEQSATACSLSSARFKENVRDINYGIGEVMQLRPVLYDLKPEYGTAKNQPGFIAEEAMKVVPELVPIGADGLPSGFDYPKYVAVLTKAIQDQQAQIEELRVAVNGGALGGYIPQPEEVSWFERVLNWIKDLFI